MIRSTEALGWNKWRDENEKMKIRLTLKLDVFDEKRVPIN